TDQPAGAKAHAHPHVPPLVVTPQFALDVVAHHFGEAPKNALGEPARHDVAGDARADQQIAVGRNDAARARQILFAGADKLPDHRHRRARQRRAADPDRRSVVYQRSRLFEADGLLAQRTSGFEEAVANDVVGLHQVRAHADTFVSRSQFLAGCQELAHPCTSYHSKNSESSLSGRLAATPKTLHLAAVPLGSALALIAALS